MAARTTSRFSLASAVRNAGIAAGSASLPSQAADAVLISPLLSVNPCSARSRADPCRASNACASGRLRRESPTATDATVGSNAGGMAGKASRTARASPTSDVDPPSQACSTSRRWANQGQVTSGCRVSQ